MKTRNLSIPSLDIMDLTGRDGISITSEEAETDWCGEGAVSWNWGSVIGLSYSWTKCSSGLEETIRGIISLPVVPDSVKVGVMHIKERVAWRCVGI